MEQALAHLISVDGLISLLTLTVLEVILGIDNVIFISIICSKLPKEQQDKARTSGVLLALFARIGLLSGISWLTQLTNPLFTVLEHDFSGKDIILLAGGLFLIGKSIGEIHDKLEGEEDGEGSSKKMSMAAAIVQIILIDMVFSFDSILTAVGLSRNLLIMILAVVLGLGIMLFFAKLIGQFVEKHPTVKMLALSFLVLIGFLLMVEAFGEHVPKGYVYFAMVFSLAVEYLNMVLRKRTIKSELTNPQGDQKPESKTKEVEDV